MSNDDLILATNRTVDEIRKRISFADWHKYDDTVSDSDIRYNIALAGFKKFELPTIMPLLQEKEKQYPTSSDWKEPYLMYAAKSRT